MVTQRFKIVKLNSLTIVAVLCALVFRSSNLASAMGYCVDNCQQPAGHGVRGAPGPIAGAGLPVLAVGYGVYWLIRRRRKSK